MKATYDLEEIELSERFLNALQELMRAKIQMMKEHDEAYADCWTWGLCTISDLATRYLDFEYGGDDCKPDEFPEGVDVMVKVDNPTPAWRQLNKPPA